jgi:transposase InsO family protein
VASIAEKWRLLRGNPSCEAEAEGWLRAAVPDRAWPRTTVSDLRLPTFENILERDFAAEAPDRKWASGITYVPTDEGWLYLSMVLDLSPIGCEAGPFPVHRGVV